MVDMEAIDGEGAVKNGKMQGFSGREEKILVLVRLRPLSEKEIAVNEVADWECINDATVLYRNTLREGSTFPSAYTFDRVFRGDSSTRQVYEEGAKEIVLSVVSGINSSIFAYGQTSSGKTYTMTGITEYAVADIFDYVNRHEERAFALKFSAIEIYNEAIRDLLSKDSTPLRLRDDPEKGVIVDKATEETLQDWSHFKELLLACEAQRRIGETTLNEKSSRSHQIIKLTIESSAREFLGKDSSTTLSASVNFVDLAGSERASQALSAGSRLKEGCHINRSLLTLGTVIRKLSNGRGGHVNYRDSKLTRILQPALGGNARTAIICTLSPARSHVEQTRNTLLFACCAKEVTTKAQVNIVMSDKALVKHLQKELARLETEIRTPAPAPSSCNCAALIRKKDLQIEKMEKDIRVLVKQRDHAQSRVEGLLQLSGNDQDSRQAKTSGSLRQTSDSCDDEDSVSGTTSAGETNYQHVGMRKFDNPHYYEGEEPYHKVNDKYCKEVQCIETEEMSGVTSGDGDMMGTEILSDPVNQVGEVSQIQNGYASGSIRSNRSWSCRENLMVGSSDLDGEDQSECTPPNGLERLFSGRAEGFLEQFSPLNNNARYARLMRNDSQSSTGSASINGVKTPTGEDMPSIHTFISGLKKTKLQYEKQLGNNQIGAESEEFKENGRDVGLDPMLEASRATLDWPLEFERLQRAILELWQTCNVSLVHRTYFFLLFKGDPSDSIYMEVELRRLSYLKETFSQGTQAVEDGRTITLASSMRALRREREMLSRLIYKRFSKEERYRLYEKWDIEIRSKRRRFQLANLLWSNPGDLNHVIDSATIVAKLIRFVEQGQAFKEMFGLSFTPPTIKCKSWRRGLSFIL